MMALQDLSHMKWCHIRAMESNQGVERENIHLRRIITDLKSKNAQLEKLAYDCSTEMKAEVITTKSAYSNEMSSMNQSYTVLTKAVAKLVTILSDRKRRMSNVCNENIALNESLQALKKGQKEADVQNLMNTEKSRNKILKLKEQLAASEVMRTALWKENELLRDGNSSEKNSLDLINAELLKLKQKIVKTEIVCQEAVSAARKNELNCRLECDEVVKETECEISKLLQFNYELQKENDRLMAAIVPPENINHFAKFVQLKSENVALKSQLSTVSNRKSSFGTPPIAGIVSINTSNFDRTVENSKKNEFSLLVEKRKNEKNEKNFDRSSGTVGERSVERNITLGNSEGEHHHRPLAERIMERNLEKNNDKNNDKNSKERSLSNLDFSMSGSSPIKYSKRSESTQINSTDNMNSGSSNYNDEREKSVEDGSESSHTNININTNIKNRKASFEFVDSVDDLEENEADEIFLRSVEAIGRADGGSFIGVPLLGKQTRNALKERLLL